VSASTPIGAGASPWTRRRWGTYFDRVFCDDFNGLLDTGWQGNWETPLMSSTRRLDAPMNI
jgi:hypothetical protein